MVPTESFFNFFAPPKVPEDDEDDGVSDIEERLELDYQLGEDIKEKLIPRAIDWFTGEALAYEELDEDEEPEFEDEDDEDDEDEEEHDDDEESDEEVGLKSFLYREVQWLTVERTTAANQEKKKPLNASRARSYATHPSSN